MKRRLFLLLVLFQLFNSIQLHAQTVVCIHGFMTTFKSLMPVKGVLRGAGYDVCLWDYPSRRRRIEEHACALVPVLQEIACHCPGIPIHFVTHSTGALVLRAALNNPGCPEEAKMGRAVLLAPPNQGSQLARRYRDFPPVNFFMGDKSGCQLMNYDPCQIQCFGQFPSSMEVFVIAGTRGSEVLFCETNDGFLTLDETVLCTPFYWKTFPLSHGALLTCQPVLCCTKQFLLCGCGGELISPEPCDEDPGETADSEIINARCDDDHCSCLPNSDGAADREALDGSHSSEPLEQQ